MKYLKIPLAKQILPTAEWATFVPEEIPSIYRIADGSHLVCVSPSSKYWVSSADSVWIISLMQEEIEASLISPAPSPQNSVSEKTLLMAMAIAQRPELAKDLLQ